MKKVLLFIAIIAAFSSCANSSSETTTEDTSNKNGIEVIYFHGKKRCITCNAIESLSKEVLETKYAEELKTGKIVMKIIDISQKENDPITARYEVTWSSLFANLWENGEETPNNLTKMGFSYAKNQPEVFKEQFTAMIEQLLASE